MPQYVAFLRGINLGKRRLTMSRLASAFTEMGYRSVATFIASGNVIFESPVKDSTLIEARVSAFLETALGFSVDTFVRTPQEVAKIADRRLFPEDEEGAAITIHVGFMRQPLAAGMARRFEAVRTAQDQFRVIGSEFYWLCRTRISESKIWAHPEIKALKLPTATMRNITTLRKLVSRHFNDMA